jgi:anthranilate synthase component 1
LHGSTVAVTPLVTELAASECSAPVALFGRLRDENRAAGLGLLESSGSPGSELPTTRRSVVVRGGLLRVELRGGTLSCRALVDAGEELLAVLSRGLPDARLEGKSLTAEYPVEPGSSAIPDDQRLTRPSSLDGLRVASRLIADRRSGAALAPGLFGAFSYEIVDQFERLPPRRPDPLQEPDASFVLGADLVVHDRAANKVQVVTRGLPWENAMGVRDRHAQCVALLREREEEPQCPARGVVLKPAATDVEDDQFLGAVGDFLEQIAAGEIFQGVLSRGMAMPSPADPLQVYAALRRRNPSPYMFFLDLPDGALLGASPETFLRVEDGIVEIRPIAGTVARGRRPDGTIEDDLDRRLALSLLLDPKEQAEHAMLLDLARNDVARVSLPGTTRVVQQFVVEKYSHVQHLVSRVRGELRPELDALHAYRAAANMGTLTGAPKVRAMELIRDAEPYSRGFYGGAAGYLLQDGSLDSCIVIRSLRYKDGVYHTRTGAGIVWDSVPDKELIETEHKARAVREAVSMAEEVGS